MIFNITIGYYIERNYDIILLIITLNASPAKSLLFLLLATSNVYRVTGWIRFRRRFSGRVGKMQDASGFVKRKNFPRIISFILCTFIMSLTNSQFQLNWNDITLNFSFIVKKLQISALKMQLVNVIQRRWCSSLSQIRLQRLWRRRTDGVLKMYHPVFVVSCLESANLGGGWVSRVVPECFNTKIDIRGKLPGNGALSSGVTWPAISDKLTGKHGIDFSTAKLGFRGVSPLTLNRSPIVRFPRALGEDRGVINRCKRRWGWRGEKSRDWKPSRWFRRGAK